jgi:hypothetical protein
MLKQLRPVTFVLLAAALLVPIAYDRDTAKRIHATTTVLTAGHVPMVSMPSKVADVIVEAANNAGK